MDQMASSIAPGSRVQTKRNQGWTGWFCRAPAQELNTFVFSPSRLICLHKLTYIQQGLSLKLALSVCLVPRHKLSWPGSRLEAKDRCSSQLNRWHAPFLSVKGLQRLHPWCQRAPKSDPIKMPMRCVEWREFWGELNVFNPTIIKWSETKEDILDFNVNVLW